MIFLDTHIVIWLYDGLLEKFGMKTRRLMEASDLYICPIVLLEMTYLRERKFIKNRPDQIFTHLAGSIGLKQSTTPLIDLVEYSTKLMWLKDPFDRIIIADAAFNDAQLVSADHIIRNNYQSCIF